MPYFAFIILLLLGNVPAIIIVWLCRKRFFILKKAAYIWLLLFSTLQTVFFVDEISGLKKKRLFDGIQQDFPIHFQDLDEERKLFSMALVAEKMQIEYPYSAQKTVMQDFMQKMLPKMNYQIARDTFSWKNNALYLSQMSIIFSAYHAILPNDTSYQKLHQNMIHFLYREMKNSAQHQLCSYPDFAEPWLCDNAGVLYALALYDKAYQTNGHISLFKDWEVIVKQNFTDSNTGLPCTQVNADSGCFVPTRGSSTAWLISYLSILSHEEGKNVWDLYKKHFKFSFAGIGAAFYEYADDTCIEDYDSGTIVWGLGSVASGLAIRAAQKNEDWLSYFQLTNAFKVVSVVSLFFPELSDDILVKAILYNTAF